MPQPPTLEAALAKLEYQDPAEFATNIAKTGFNEVQMTQLVNEMLVAPDKLAWRMGEWAAGRHGFVKKGEKPPIDEHTYEGGPLVSRDGFAHPTSAPLAPPLPRITVAELASRPEYRNRSRPFVLTDAMIGWPALERWKTVSYFTSLFGGEARSEFYPHNLMRNDGRTALHKPLSHAASQLLLSPGDAGDAYPPPPPDDAAGRYLHVQVTPVELEALEAAGDVPRDRNALLRGDEWMDECLTAPEVRAEYMLKTHWQVLLVGSRGAAMFNHTDALRTASWHAHAVGRKWWYVCKGAAGGCYEGVLEPGEVLSYGDGWAHLTQNLQSPTVAMTGTVVHAGNWHKVAQRLRGDCVTPAAMRLHFSAPLCDALDVCFGQWRRQWGAGRGSAWPPWREVASMQTVHAKKQIDASKYPNPYGEQARPRVQSQPRVLGRDEL